MPMEKRRNTHGGGPTCKRPIKSYIQNAGVPWRGTIDILRIACEGVLAKKSWKGGGGIKRRGP